MSGGSSFTYSDRGNPDNPDVPDHGSDNPPAVTARMDRIEKALRAYMLHAPNNTYAEKQALAILDDPGDDAPPPHPPATDYAELVERLRNRAQNKRMTALTMVGPATPHGLTYQMIFNNDADDADAAAYAIERLTRELAEARKGAKP